MDESTITKIALKTIEDALEQGCDDRYGDFSCYVDGVITVTNSLLKKQKELNKVNNAKPKPKKRLFM